MTYMYDWGHMRCYGNIDEDPVVADGEMTYSQKLQQLPCK